MIHCETWNQLHQSRIYAATITKILTIMLQLKRVQHTQHCSFPYKYFSREQNPLSKQQQYVHTHSMYGLKTKYTFMDKVTYS